MIKVGIISDTHLKNYSVNLTEKLVSVFDGVDYILHAGDVVRPIILDSLEEIAPVIAVQGNSDYHPLITVLPVKRVVQIKAVRIGLIHGWGSPEIIQARVQREFTGQDVQAIVYGHTHIPRIESLGDILFINPGSPTEPRNSHNPTVAVLAIDGVSLTTTIVDLDK